MAGIFDELDAALKANPALGQGLLTAGLTMMGTRGRLGQQLSAGGLAGMQSMQQAKEQARQQAFDELQKQQIQGQLDAQKRAAEAEARRQAWLQSIPDPTQQALAGGGGPTVQNAAKIDPWQQTIYSGVRAGALPVETLIKDNTPQLGEAAPGSTVYDKRTGKPVFTAKPKEDDFITNLRASGVLEGSPQWNQALSDWIKKQSTHQPATTVNVSADKSYGATVAEQAAKDLAASRDKARAAAQSLQAIDRIGAALDGGAITGLGASAQTVLTRVGDFFNVGGKDAKEKLAKTAELLQGQASLAVQGAQLLAGQGQITEGERALVNRAAGGDLQSMSPSEIRAFIDVLGKVHRLALTQHDALLAQQPPEMSKYLGLYRVPPPMIRPAAINPAQAMGPGSMGFGTPTAPGQVKFLGFEK